MKGTAFLAIVLAACGVARADYRVEMHAIDIKGVGFSLGHVTLAAAPQGGVVFTPSLKGLPPGLHGFHVHEFADCGARERDGQLIAGEMAGGHWDPDETHKHGAPDKGGHKGDLPALSVAEDRTATEPVRATRLKLAQLRGKSLVIHAGGDNQSDAPEPNGGGGQRIACGVIQDEPKR